MPHLVSCLKRIHFVLARLITRFGPRRSAAALFSIRFCLLWSAARRALACWHRWRDDAAFWRGQAGSSYALALLAPWACAPFGGACRVLSFGATAAKDAAGMCQRPAGGARMATAGGRRMHLSATNQRRRRCIWAFCDDINAAGGAMRSTAGGAGAMANGRRQTFLCLRRVCLLRAAAFARQSAPYRATASTSTLGLPACIGAFLSRAI